MPKTLQVPLSHARSSRYEIRNNRIRKGTSSFLLGSKFIQPFETDGDANLGFRRGVSVEIGDGLCGVHRQRGYDPIRFQSEWRVRRL